MAQYVDGSWRYTHLLLVNLQYRASNGATAFSVPATEEGILALNYVGFKSGEGSDADRNRNGDMLNDC